MFFKVVGIVGVVGREAEGGGENCWGLREESRGDFGEVLSWMGVSWGTGLVRKRVNDGVHGGVCF